MRRFAVFLVVLIAIVSVGIWQKTHAWTESPLPAAPQAQLQNSNWSSGECTAESGKRFSLWGAESRVCELRTSTIQLSGQHLGVSSDNGGIQVTGEDRSDVKVEATVQAWARSESEARDILRQVQIDTNGDEIRDRGPRSQGGKGYGIHYKIHVPKKLSVDLHGMNGGINIAHLTGHLRFNTTNGGIHLEDVAGDARGATVNGGVEVALNGDHWLGEGLEVETTNGGISLNIPENYSAHLEAGTTNGGIHVNFPIKIVGAIRNQLSTDLGNGGPTIHAVTVNGGIQIGHEVEKGKDTL